jgi:hypothetical protein
MSTRFEDHYFHIDGSCYEADVEVQQCCKEHTITSSPVLQMYFEEKIVKQLLDLLVKCLSYNMGRNFW